MRVRFRPALPGDFIALYGCPAPPHRLRAIAAELDGELVGLGGIVYRPDGVFAFAQLAPALRSLPAAVHRAGLAGMVLIRAAGVVEVFAEAQPDNPAAERWLERFGFVRDGGVFVWRRRDDDLDPRPAA